LASVVPAPHASRRKDGLGPETGAASTARHRFAIAAEFSGDDYQLAVGESELLQALPVVLARNGLASTQKNQVVILLQVWAHLGQNHGTDCAHEGRPGEEERELARWQRKRERVKKVDAKLGGAVPHLRRDVVVALHGENKFIERIVSNDAE